MSDGYGYYWGLRFVFGVGPWVTLLVALYFTHGFDTTFTLTVWTALAFVAGGVIGLLWDGVVAAGVAGWVVYGSARDGLGGPPLFNPEPRTLFA